MAAVADKTREVSADQGLTAALLECTVDCIKVLDVEGRLLSMNGPGLCAMEIADFAPLAGMSWASLWPPETQADVESAVEAAVAGRVARFSAFCQTARGTPKWWEVTVAPVTGRDGSIEKLVSTSRDVTPLREAKSQAQQHRSLLREVIEHNPHMFWIADAEGRITEVNAARLQFLGRDASEATGSGWARFIHPDDLQRYLEGARQAARTRSTFDIVFRLLAATGEHRWVHSRAHPKVVEGRIFNWYGYCEDVHDQKLARDALDERERQLRESEDRYRLAAQATRDAIWEWDLLTDRVTRANAEVSAYGYPAHQISNTGQWWKDHLHPEDREATLDALEAALSGTSEVWTAEYRYRRADGTYAVATDRAFIVRGDDGAARRLVGATRDITEEVRVAEALRKSEEHHRYTVELAPQIPFVMDREAKLVEISSRWTEVTGQPVEAALGHGWHAITHPDDAEAVGKAARHSITTGAPYDQRSRKRTADGDYRWFRVRVYPRRDEAGHVICWYGYAEDIDEAVRAGEALRESEERLRLVTASAEIGVYDAGPDGIALCSPIYLDLYGLPHETERLSYKDWLALVHPEDRGRIRKATSSAVAGSGRFDYEFRIIRADTGEVRWIDNRGRLRLDGQPGTARSIGAQWDVTERKRAEQELDRLQRQALQASRLNAMGAMAATIAHELNQPLAAASNYLAAARAYLKRSGTDAKAFEDVLTGALDQTQRAGEIVRKLRSFVSDGVVSTQPTRCLQIATNASRLAANGEPSLQPTISISDDAEMASADAVQVEQVLCNLLRNAQEALQGRVDPHLAISITRADPDFVRISVEDNGVGVCSEAARNLFSPFASTKEDGMGVGLSISRMIVEAHGGQIQHEPRPGGGAIFSFTLPAEHSTASAHHGL